MSHTARHNRLRTRVVTTGFCRAWIHPGGYLHEGVRLTLENDPSTDTQSPPPSVAVSCADAGATEVTLLSRTPHWAAPRKLANLIPYQHIFQSRLGQALIVGLKGPMPGSSPTWASAWHAASWPLMAAVHPQPETRNPKPQTLTLNPKP